MRNIDWKTKWQSHPEKWFILVPLYLVISPCSVATADKITTEYTENTEKIQNKKSKTQ